jgi:superfamily II DNA or RNA helicase
VEILQPVRVRRERWRVAAVCAFDACRLLTLTSATATRRVLTPFDDVEPIASSDRPKRVSARRWRHACRWWLARHSPPGGLRTAAAARIDLLPHQLEPALAVLRGAGSRVLLADDVGLGKTIQAGLIVAELMARGAVDRVLILTPAGVRDQWSREWRERFAIETASADAAALRRLAATLPMGVNPWQTMAVTIASIDYVKRLEVLPSVRAVLWDVVVIDEAHAAAGDSERRHAVRALADRAAYVVLLTATPHNGDERAFDDLCRIGDIGAAGGERTSDLVVFRRTRAAIRGEGSRRIHVLPVRSSVAERHMRDALARYRRAVAAEHGDRALALSVLDKRALSSPWSLAQSIDRRLATLSTLPDEARPQLMLPLDDPDDESIADDAPPLWPGDLALADAREDRRLLTAVAASARTAALHDESKVRCLVRLLRRVRESVLVFTEYRDTALHLVSAIGRPAWVLHGGLDRHQRASVIDAFTRTGGAVLIATDAAGQGLNLHHACRLVVNVELPWNPMRLEQRIGRVDRIGQSRRVHAIHLVAQDTAEENMLGRLRARVGRAQSRIDAPDPIGSDRPRVAIPATMTLTSEAARAEAEVSRLTAARALLRSARGRPPADADAERPLLARARRRRLRAALAGRALFIFRVDVDDEDGRTIESAIVPVLVDDDRGSTDQPRVPSEWIAAWERSVDAVACPFHATRIARERDVAAAFESAPAPALQPGLFDRRLERAHLDAAVRRADAVRDARLRLDAANRRRRFGAPTSRLLLVVRP